jgi:DNA repair protein RecO (recombination protein O)
MRWTDDGIFLLGRPHGETNVIADIFTRNHGRTSGLVKGGRSRRLRPLLQTGNGLSVDWRARLEDQLGVYTIELVKATAARLLDDKLALFGVTALASLLQVLPERDPHPKLFEAAIDCLASAGEENFPVLMIRFEFSMLDELGFGLDLSRCAATGRTDDLVYVSPRSGQAVAREAGEPYREKLLRLPDFMKPGRTGGSPSSSDIADGFNLTGYFLNVHVFSESNRPLPKAREEFARLLNRQKY